MDRKLNYELVRTTAQRAGYSFTKLAREVAVSTESVSKWMNGETNPRPGKAIKLGKALGLSYEQMFGARDRALEPQVAFRLVRNQNPSEEHRERARELGRMYEDLVPFLPFNRFEAPPRLKSPTAEYDYLDELASSLRREMGLEADVPVSLPSIFNHLSDKLQAVVIPVFWGHRKNKAELAAHIYSRKTKTTWIPFNLDAKLWDARFWAAHELAHVYTFDVLDDESSEVFSDAFAGTLVFPVSIAKAAYEDLQKARLKSQRLSVLVEYAKRMHVSPICVAKQVDRFAVAKKLPSVNAEYEGLYPAVSMMSKREKTVAGEFFGDGEPSVSQLCEATANIFKSPFFDTLSKYLKASGGSPSFIQGLLDCSLVDAKALNSELA
jgi:transcriptional regulator with XRE-family HTH domain